MTRLHWWREFAKAMYGFQLLLEQERQRKKRRQS